jgi:hypothetical protein
MPPPLSRIELLPLEIREVIAKWTAHYTYSYHVSHDLMNLALASRRMHEATRPEMAKVLMRVRGFCGGEVDAATDYVYRVISPDGKTARIFMGFDVEMMLEAYGLDEGGGGIDLSGTGAAEVVETLARLPQVNDILPVPRTIQR